MNLFIEKHRQLIKALIAGKVSFIIIGGYSVIYHGYARTTGDVDIWLRPDNKNRDLLMPVLHKLDLKEEDIQTLSQLDFSKHLVFSIWEEPEKADFITRINMVDFEEADASKEYLPMEGLQIPFLHLNHLILSKINTGRAKDAADVEELQKIKNQRKQND